ncbi:hypothetical protein [Paenibacillus sp. 32352]|uniref:hypothetical protein n=1 Tax=Paenibacillus sp. 32352 TaxID=1969111 RepID=UPI0009ABC19D|nr:hypothetical protein [Paenibacillus sp. 32352]
MLIHEKDITYYTILDSNYLKDLPHFVIREFEHLQYNDIDAEVTEIEYNWADPVKIKDKVISRQTRSIVFWILKRQNALCIFSNSESEVAYLLSKLENRQVNYFKKINIYDIWKKKFMESDEKSLAELVSIQVKREITASNSIDFNSIQVNKLKKEEIINYLSSNNICFLTFKLLDTNGYFNLDSSSVISMNDTDTYEDIKNVIFQVSKLATSID